MGETRARRWMPAAIVVAAIAFLWSLGARIDEPVVPSAASVRRTAAGLGSEPGPARLVPAPEAFAPRGEHDGAGSDREHARRAAPEPWLRVEIPYDMQMTSRPGEGRVVGVVPGGSKYYGTPTVAWVQELSRDRRFGRLAVPYSESSASGWIRLEGLPRHRTTVTIAVDISRHEVTLERRGEPVATFDAATGTTSTPTPPGRYFVTDRVPFPGGGPLGTFAFGISGIQPRLPAGWTGGDQLAIHGTTTPSSIGQSASAGCLRVSPNALKRLKPLVRLGTPVIIRP